MANNFNNLNAKQMSAAEAPLKPLLIIAGAGTGKTQTLTSRLINILGKNPPGRKIIAITFTNKAANEMKTRVEKAGVRLNGDEEVFVGTFHSFGARLLRREARLVKRSAGFTIFDDDDSLSVIKKIIKNFNFKKKISPAEIQDKISLVKNNLLKAESAGFEDQEVFEEIFSEYETALAENNAFDFDDLIEKSVRILNDNPELLGNYRSLISHILIDEYQDINKAQYALVKLLVGEEGGISAVGDDQQAIYSWRGANFEFFLNFEKDWPKSSVVVLEENYRSTGKIIKAASELIKNNGNQKEKNLWTRKEEGKGIEVLEAESASQEAEWIVQKIRTFSDVNSAAVLYRTNAQSRAIEQSLIQNGIPYRIIGGLKFYERREIKDVVSALRFFSNPLDSVSASRLEKLLKKRGFVFFKEKWLAGANDQKISPADLIAKFLKLTDYFDYLKNNFINAADRKENVKELIGFASGFSGLGDFLERLVLFEAADELNPEKKSASSSGRGSGVKLTTIHLAKGLEFEKVFIAGCAEGLLPHARSLISSAETEEERRLMYVAMTRAKAELYISFYGIPSRFLAEIPPELIEFKSLNVNRNFSDFESFRNRNDEEDYIDY